MGNYGIIASIIIGAIAGWIASKIMGRDAQVGSICLLYTSDAADE